MHVIISDEAIEDLDSIWDFLASSSIVSADRVVDELIDQCESLREMPSRHPLLPDHEGGLRRLAVRTWAIYFRLRDDHVDIVRIVHGGRDVRRLGLR